jgi:flavodoxin I
MAKIGIFFGSSTGNTEFVTEKLQEILGSELADLINVDSATEKDIDKYDYLILATSTWGIGDMQDDMEDFAELLVKAELKKKKIALLGLGDQDTYPDSFVDGIGTLYTMLKDKTTIVGEWPTKEYSFTDSDAVIGNKFVGLVIDQDNQPEFTEERLKKWAAQVKKGFGV